MSERHTDVEDLTMNDCKEILFELVPTLKWRYAGSSRDALREVTSLLDRTGADWPHIILGLEPTS